MSVQFWERTVCNIDHEDFKTKFCFEYPTNYYCMVCLQWDCVLYCDTSNGTSQWSVNVHEQYVQVQILESGRQFRCTVLCCSAAIFLYFMTYFLKLAQIGCKQPSALCCSLRLNNSISRPNGFSGNLRFPKRILVALVFFKY